LDIGHAIGRIVIAFNPHLTILIVVLTHDVLHAVGVVGIFTEEILVAARIALLTFDKGISNVVGGMASTAAVAAAAATGRLFMSVVMMRMQILPTLTGWQWLSIGVLVVQMTWWAGCVHVIEKLEERSPEGPSR
jgi:hypothetical protein